MYLKYFLHLLHFFPVFAVKAKISILFAFEGWHFLSIICQLNKQVHSLINSIIINS